jgi:hypothetical protein
MAVYVFCRNAQSKPHSDPHDVCTLSLLYQLPNCNLFTQHALFILWRDTTSELWTPVQFPLHSFTILLLLALFTFTCILLSYYHSIRSFLCLQQTGEIDNLIVSWEQSTCLCCAGFMLLLVEDTPLQVIWRHCLECHKASKHHLLKFGFLLLVRSTLVSQLREDLLLCSSYLPLGVPN